MASREHPPTELLWPNPKSGPWWALVHWKEIDGRPECVGLELWHGRGSEAKPITTTTLRALRPDGMIAEARRRYAAGLDRSVEALDRYIAIQHQAAGHGGTKPSPFQPTREVRSPTGSPHTQALRDRRRAVQRTRKPKAGSKPRGRPKGRKHSDDHWPKVAECYIEARRNGFPPTSAVAAAFEVAHSTAANWIAHCREAGLLPPTTRGKARS
jgi:hypothetical protein